MQLWLIFPNAFNEFLDQLPSETSYNRYVAIPATIKFALEFQWLEPQREEVTRDKWGPPRTLLAACPKNFTVNTPVTTSSQASWTSRSTSRRGGDGAAGRPGARERLPRGLRATPPFPGGTLPTCFHQLALLAEDVGEGDGARGRTGRRQRRFHGSSGVSDAGHVAASRLFRVSKQTMTSPARDP